MVEFNVALGGFWVTVREDPASITEIAVSHSFLMPFSVGYASAFIHSCFSQKLIIRPEFASQDKLNIRHDSNPSRGLHYIDSLLQLFSSNYHRLLLAVLDVAEVVLFSESCFTTNLILCIFPQN